MKAANTVAAGFLGIGFGVVSYIAIAVEPQMGFATPADFFDATKVMAGYTTTAWLVDNIIYLMFPVALVVLAESAHDERAARSGWIAAVMFLLLGALDRVGIQLPSFASDDGAMRSALAAMLLVRAAVLKTTVVAVGVFAWRTTRAPAESTMWTRAWRAFGWIVLAASGAFVFTPVPVPLLFALWGVGLAARTATAGDDVGHGAPTPHSLDT